MPFIPLYAQARDANEKELVRFLREDMGLLVFSLSQPVDLLVQLKSGALILEVKSQRGRLTPSQKRFISEWSRSPVFVVRSTADARAVIEELSQDK